MERVILRGTGNLTVIDDLNTNLATPANRLYDAGSAKVAFVEVDNKGTTEEVYYLLSNSSAANLAVRTNAHGEIPAASKFAIKMHGFRYISFFCASDVTDHLVLNNAE